MENEQLNSVEFVRDYLQLHFNDKTLTCFIWPSVIRNGFEYTSDHPDYKNQLCSLIAKNVTGLNVNEIVSLTITFGSDLEISLSLDPNNPKIRRDRNTT